VPAGNYVILAKTNLEAFCSVNSFGCGSTTSDRSFQFPVPVNCDLYVEPFDALAPPSSLGPETQIDDWFEQSSEGQWAANLQRAINLPPVRTGVIQLPTTYRVRFACAAGLSSTYAWGAFNSSVILTQATTLTATFQ
jgi:hypothetical protein